MQWGYAVVQFVQALRYKSEGGGFDSRWILSDFQLTQSFRPHWGSEVDSATNRNEYQGSSVGGKDGQCVRLRTLPPLGANCLEILGASTSCTPLGLSRYSFIIIILFSYFFS